MSARKPLNLFYFNIFRFERYTQYLATIPFYGLIRLVGLGEILAKRSGRSDWDEYILSVLNDPKSGISINLTGMHIALLTMLLLLALLNLVCGSFALDLDTFWFYGMLVAAAIGLALSNYIAPVNSKKYISDFRKFESMSPSMKRRSALITLIVYIGIWGVFIASSAFYMRTLVK